LVVLSAAVWGTGRLLRSPDVNELLARAYTERRTIELRMAGAAYGSMRVERGAAQSRQNLPESLLEAEMILTRDAKKHVEDPNWLESQARASLLEWDYESAITELDDALTRRPDDLSLLLDKATAHFERAEKLGPQGAIDYGEAAEDLSKVLKRSPDDSVALFNRAIIFEKLYLPNEAIADLDHCVRVAPNGAWATEAKERAEQLRRMVKSHALAEHLVDPVTFVQLASDPADAGQLDLRIEDYQDRAIREWLPIAFPVKASVEGERTRSEHDAALRALAKMLLERHDDKWLSDLLESANDTPSFASAVWDLSQAVARSAAGDPLDSRQAAAKAVGSFVAEGNKAGALRAEVEQVHSLQRSHETIRCRKEASVLLAVLRKTSYAWMSGQLLIDQAACSLTAANFDDGLSLASAALRQALNNGFPELHLRALGIVSAGNNFEGDLAAAWGRNEEGLARYWQKNSSSLVRAH
jgi:tetratricopeptide (TPR) repeat protein